MNPDRKLRFLGSRLGLAFTAVALVGIACSIGPQSSQYAETPNKAIVTTVGPPRPDVSFGVPSTSTNRDAQQDIETPDQARLATAVASRYTPIISTPQPTVTNRDTQQDISVFPLYDYDILDQATENMPKNPEEIALWEEAANAGPEKLTIAFAAMKKSSIKEFKEAVDALERFIREGTLDDIRPVEDLRVEGEKEPYIFQAKGESGRLFFRALYDQEVFTRGNLQPIDVAFSLTILVNRMTMSQERFSVAPSRELFDTPQNKFEISSYALQNAARAYITAYGQGYRGPENEFLGHALAFASGEQNPRLWLEHVDRYNLKPGQLPITFI